MNILKGLILKDFMNIKSYKSTIIYLLIIFVVTSIANNEISTFMPIMITMIFGMIGLTAFSYDSYSKADKFILSLPAEKSDIVKARYLYVLIATIIGAIVGLIISIGMSYIKNGFTEIENIVSSIVGAFLGMIILQIIQLPIMYKFGAEKGRIIQMITIVVIMGIISGISILFIKVSPYDLDSFLEMLKKYGFAIIAVVLGILYFMSYKVSCKIYSKKEV